MIRKQIYFIIFLLLSSIVINPSWANSCSNLYIHGSFDDNKVVETDTSIHAAGTFRIEGEAEENKQPDFNLTMIDCDKSSISKGKVYCRVIRAISMAHSEQPSADKPNCALDLQVLEYQMKEIAPKMLTGTVESGICYNSFLTIDGNSNRVNMTFTKTKSASNVKDICSDTPKTQTLMNCTQWASVRSQNKLYQRYCDFSSSDSK